jgi:hypothetical protein
LPAGLEQGLDRARQGLVVAILNCAVMWQCAASRYQVSVTAGTVLHRTRGFKRELVVARVSATWNSR